MHAIRSPSGLNAVVTAGTDMRIRFWNLANALDSFIVHGAGSETVNPSLVSYRCDININKLEGIIG